MENNMVSLAQSKFFSPVFNAAIFDGPFRIYFAQALEPSALKVYFQIQQELGDLYEKAKVSFKQHGENVYVMLYPNADGFDMSFDVEPFDSGLCVEMLGAESVFGVRGELPEGYMKPMYEKIEALVTSWNLDDYQEASVDEALECQI